MGLKEHMDSDLRGVFFSEQDFAESAVYRPVNGADFLLSVLYSDAYAEVEPGGLGAIQAEAVRVVAPAAVFPNPPGPNDSILLRGRAFRVLSAQPDGLGLVTFTLQDEDA